MDLERGLALEREVLSILARKFLFIIIVILKSTIFHMAPSDFDLHGSMFSECLHFFRLYRIPCVFHHLLPTPGPYVNSSIWILHNGCRTSELDNFWVTDIPTLTLVISFMLGQKRRFMQHETDKAEGYISPLLSVIKTEDRHHSLKFQGKDTVAALEMSYFECQMA